MTEANVEARAEASTDAQAEASAGAGETARTRGPKQDRSRATREALLAAAIETLATRGWSAATVGAVAEAAGVSRGAAQHHFPTREDLVTAALAHIAAERAADIAAATSVDGLGPSERIAVVVGAIVDHYTGELFKAALQIWTAAASDPALRDRIVPVEAEISRAVFAWAAERIGVDLDDEPSRRALQTTLDLARGLGLADVLADDSARRARIVAFWAADLGRTLRLVGG